MVIIPSVHSHIMTVSPERLAQQVLQSRAYTHYRSQSIPSRVLADDWLIPGLFLVGSGQSLVGSRPILSLALAGPCSVLSRG